MKTKKQKILTGILIPTGTLAIAAGVTAGIVVGLNNKTNTSIMECAPFGTHSKIEIRD